MRAELSATVKQPTHCPLCREPWTDSHACAKPDPPRQPPVRLSDAEEMLRGRWMGDLDRIPLGKVVEFMQSYADSRIPARKYDAEGYAKAFHETYERLAPQFSYETRKESAVPWEQVPERNRQLMIAVCAELLSGPVPDAVLALPAKWLNPASDDPCYFCRTLGVLCSEHQEIAKRYADELAAALQGRRA